jgi:hypothetical protein
MTTVYNEECCISSHILYLNIKLKHYPDNTPVQVDLDSLYSETIIQIGFQNTICIENITRMNCWLILHKRQRYKNTYYSCQN